VQLARSAPRSVTPVARAGLWLAIGVAGIGFAALAVSHQTAAALLLGASVLLATAIAFPRFTLLASVPAVILGDGLQVTSMSLSWPLAMALVASWVLGLLTGRWRLKPREHGIVALFGLLLVFSYFTATVLYEGEVSRVGDLILLLVGLSFLAVAISIPPSPKQLLHTISLTALVASVVTMGTASAEPGRVFALTLNPNYLAILLSVGALAAITLIRLTKNPLWGVVTVACFIAMIPTGSRGAGIAMMCGILSMLLLGRRRGVQILLVVGLLGAAYFIPWQKIVQDEIVSPTRTLTDLTNSDSVRTRAAVLAFHYAMEKPLTGIGYGTFAIAASLDSRVGIYVNTHNDYLRVAAESGIPALLVLLMLVGLAFHTTKRGPMRSIRPLLVVYFVGLLFANLLSNIIVTLPIWLTLGAALEQAPSRVLARAGRPSLRATRNATPRMELDAPPIASPL
jgi:O-antigen ligase